MASTLLSNNDTVFFGMRAVKADADSPKGEIFCMSDTETGKKLFYAFAVLDEYKVFSPNDVFVFELREIPEVSVREQE